MTEDQHTEVTSLGMMRAMLQIGNMVYCGDLEVRKQFRDAMKQLSEVVTAQWKVTDRFLEADSSAERET